MKMEKEVGWRGKWSLMMCLTMANLVLFEAVPVWSKNTPVIRKILEIDPGIQLNTRNTKEVVIDNGIIRITFSKPDGLITGIQYNGIDNVLDTTIDNRGYWDVVWYKPGTPLNIDKIKGTEFRVVTQNENQIEISFSRTWNESHIGHRVPLNVDKRYIIRRGSSGVYMYGILERLAGWPDVDMDQIRIVFKLQPNKFQYMAISDDRQRMMPLAKDREDDRSEPLAYKEAVLLVNPENQALRGEVDDKYMYSMENWNNRVHGWISSDPAVGFWMITPSDEFRSAGPVKQDLTSHVGPTTLSMFTSTHYAGKDMDTEYRNGEAWKKVFGPVFVYLNSQLTTKDMWEDAKRQMLDEVRSWPYDFVESKDFPSADERGTVAGQLLVRDRYISRRIMMARFACVGLAAPGETGSWQKEAKGYQFWTQTDNKGYFTIKNVRPGTYNLYAWVPGFIGDYKHNADILIKSGSMIKLGSLVYEPPRNGPTMWEIGIPDRTAGEFYIPDPYPTLMSGLSTTLSTNKYRQYGLWDRYTDLYPKEDLIYTIEECDYREDWFFAQVTRNTGNNTYTKTTWQIIFNLPTVISKGNYTLWIALAAANLAELQVRFNKPINEAPLFSTGMIGRDNAIARHGIHGLYKLYRIDVEDSLLIRGKNIIYLTQPRSINPFQGLMYDYIRLEGPTRI